MGYRSQDNNAHSFIVKDTKDTYQLTQDTEAYTDYAKEQRDIDSISRNGRQYRSFAILPDIVAIDILAKYKLDVHSPEFMSNPANLTKLKSIINSDYAYLRTSNIKN